MVRAATTGAIDFARFDPKDKWWWRKLGMILGELHEQDLKKTNEIQHRHWVTMMTIDGLTEDGWNKAKEGADEFLTTLLGLYFPWMKSQFKSGGNSRESALTEYREIYGYPGEPRYEEMLKQQAEAWRKIKAGWKKKGQLQEGDY